MSRANVFLLVCLACLALAAPGPAQSLWTPLPCFAASGILTNPGPAPQTVWAQDLTFPGVSALQVVFLTADLGGDEDRIRVIGVQDGEVHPLSRRGLKDWQDRSAWFNGDTVRIEVELAAGSTAQVVVRSVNAQVPQGARGSLCGADDRVPSADNHVCRLLDAVPNLGAPCTGFLINDRSVILSAGHCTSPAPSAFGVAEFNVPASLSGGVGGGGIMQHPPVADQFPIDASSVWSVALAIGDDWAVMRLHPNASGETAASRYGWFTLAASVPSMGTTTRVTGYGSDTSPAERDNTQQTSTGPLTYTAGYILRHRVDTEGGNSGSPMINDATGEVFGIHTNGGCDATSGSYNSGTAITNFVLQAAISSVSGCGGISLADSRTTITCTATIFDVTPVAGHYNVVGVSSSADWDVSIETASSAACCANADFLVSDGAFSAAPRAGVFSWGLANSSAPAATVEHASGTSVPVGTTTCVSWPAGQVLDVYELTLAAGPYDVRLTGSSSLQWSLFAPATSGDWRPRSAALHSGTVGTPATGLSLGAGTWALVVSRYGGPAASPLSLGILVVPAGTFSLTAHTSGGGVGDLCLDVQGMPPVPSGIVVLISTVPAPGGPGSGPFLGLAFSPLLADIALLPPTPFNLLHFPIFANPYAAGPLTFPAGTFAPFAGMVWEARAVAYDLTGILDMTSVVSVPW